MNAEQEEWAVNTEDHLLFISSEHRQQLKAKTVALTYQSLCYVLCTSPYTPMKKRSEDKRAHTVKSFPHFKGSGVRLILSKQ